LLHHEIIKSLVIITVSIMLFNTLLGKGIATGTLAALTAGGIYGICVAQRIASVDARRIKRTQTTTSELHQSPTIRDYANPRDHVSISDTRTYAFTIPPHHQHVSDRLLLARCIKAFYGGLVLGPERTILSLMGTKITDYPSKYLELPGHIVVELTRSRGASTNGHVVTR
jgi:hypothetical protein